MPTDAKSAFDRNIERARHFLTIHADTQAKRGRPPARMVELLRASIVFALGAVDAYISEASAEYLVASLERGDSPADSRRLLSKLDKEIPGLAFEVALLAVAEDRRARVYEAIVNHFHNKVSNHGAKPVSEFISRVGGNAKNFWADLGRDWWYPTDVLNDYTEVRHEIVHQGRSPSVTRRQARLFIEMLEDMVKALDKMADGG